MVNFSVTVVLPPAPVAVHTQLGGADIQLALATPAVVPLVPDTDSHVDVTEVALVLAQDTKYALLASMGLGERVILNVGAGVAAAIAALGYEPATLPSLLVANT